MQTEEKTAKLIVQRLSSMLKECIKDGWELDETYLVEPGWWADDGNCKVYYPSAESGQEAAEEYVSDGEWGEEPSSIDVSVWRRAVDLSTGEIEDIYEDCISVDTPNCEEDEPECDSPEGEHRWRSPHEIVGGCDTNPGVWATGGTSMQGTSVCAHCGRYRYWSSSGSQRNPGDPSKTTSYGERDERSTRYIQDNHKAELRAELLEYEDADVVDEYLSGCWWNEYQEAEWDAEELANMQGWDE